jgi:hypothetical protein
MGNRYPAVTFYVQRRDLLRGMWLHSFRRSRLITVADHSSRARSDAGIVGSNPT